jgi:hypothetical protein
MLSISPLMADLIASRVKSTLSAGHDLLKQLCKSLDYVHLDALYVHVLSTCCSDNKETAGKLLGIIALLDAHATPSLLVTLLQLSSREVLALLQAFVDALILTSETPLASITETTTLRMCHGSLRDFLGDPLRCRVTQYLVYPADLHETLLERCLSLLNEHLRRDMCEIRDPGLANTDVPDLPARIARCVPEAVRYACVSWPVHLAASDTVSETMSTGLLDLCTNHLLHWLEVLSLLGELSSAGKHLPKMIAWCEVSILFITRCNLIRTNRIIL